MAAVHEITRVAGDSNRFDLALYTVPEAADYLGVPTPTFCRAAEIIADPCRGFGQPIFAHGGAKVEDVLGAFQSGASLNSTLSRWITGSRWSSWRTRCVSPDRIAA